MNDFWEWINETLVPGLYNSPWYNGKIGQAGFLNDKMSFVVGVARIRQLRVKSGKNQQVFHIQIMALRGIKLISNPDPIRMSAVAWEVWVRE